MFPDSDQVGYLGSSCSALCCLVFIIVSEKTHSLRMSVTDYTLLPFLSFVSFEVKKQLTINCALNVKVIISSEGTDLNGPGYLQFSSNVQF